MSDEQDDKERGEWLHSLSHIHEGEHAELEFARTWADSVEVDYDEGPCAIGFTKNGATYWYLIDDVGWDVDDPRSEMLAAALAERDDLRAHLTTALRERDEARAGLAHERELASARKIVTRVSRQIDRDESLAAIQREAAMVNERGGVIAHLVGVLAEVMRATTIENARTFAEIALANIEAWHAGAWSPGPSDDAADWKPGHHRDRPSPATDKEEP